LVFIITKIKIKKYHQKSAPSIIAFSYDTHSSLYIYTDQNSYEPLARIDKRGNDPEKVMYFHTDLNGCPEELTDENGKILWECSFQLWGKRIHEIEHEPIEQNLRYQGQYLDRETSLHYDKFSKNLLFWIKDIFY
jgi:uncharacterized protein RhaS with RHS repeats